MNLRFDSFAVEVRSGLDSFLFGGRIRWTDSRHVSLKKSNLWHFSHLYEITGCDSLLSSAEFRLDRRRSVGQALASLTGRTGCGGSGTDPERRLRRNKYTPPPAGISRNGESETLNYYRKSLIMNSLISNSFGWNISREMIFSCPLFSIFCEEVGGGGTR